MLSHGSVIKLSNMWSKIYFAALALFVLAMAFLNYYAYTWLQSIGDPTIAAGNYVLYSGNAWTLLWVSSVILLILANIVLLKTKRAWAMWVTLAYFVLFVLVKYFWLERSFADFLRSNNFADTPASAGPFFAVVLCLIFGAIVFFDQFLIVRLADKIYPPPIEAETPENNPDESRED